jgi:hypothetical protein
MRAKHCNAIEVGVDLFIDGAAYAASRVGHNRQCDKGARHGDKGKDRSSSMLE